jgi:hypothetical protein
VSLELLDDAADKATHRLTLLDGKIYRAFDDVDCGLTARELVARYDANMQSAFGGLTGKVIGNSLMFAIIAVEAERRHKHERMPEDTGRRWLPYPEWQERVAKDAERAGIPPPTAFVKNPLQALVGREPVGDPDDLRWHISLAHEERVPTWDEFASAMHELRPGVPFVIGVPPRSWWMNYDDRVLHGWETKDEHLIEQWRITHEARGHADRPT